jgi:predicted permease
VFTRWRLGLRALFSRRDVEREMDDEIASHLAFATDELIAQGVPADEARRRALVEFGGVQQVRETAMSDRAFAWLDDLGRDLRQSARQLARAPFATVALMGTAGLGIAGVTMIFSFVNSVWLKPLPYEDDARLSSVRSVSPDRFVRDVMVRDIADAALPTLQALGRTAMYAEGTVRLTVGDSAMNAYRTRIDTATFGVLRLRPIAGRLPTAAEYRQSAPVALLSQELWTVLPETARVLDSTLITLDGVPHRVIGVMQAGLRFNERSQIWTPLRPQDEWVGFVIRRDPGVSADSVRGLLEGRRFAATESGATDSVQATWRLMAAPMHDRGVRLQTVGAAAFFFLITILVLVVTAANVTTQIVARTVRRRHELATCAALGATSGRLARRLFAEYAWVGLGAGIVGVIGAQLSVHAVLANIPQQGFPGWLNFGVDWRILLFAVALTSATIILIGAIPARDGSRADPLEAMREGGGLGITSRGVRQRSARLLELQLALSMVLVTMSVVAVGAYQTLAGFEHDPRDAQRIDAFAFSVGVDAPDSTRLRLIDEMKSAPAVRAAADLAVHGLAQAVRWPSAQRDAVDGVPAVWTPRSGEPMQIYSLSDATVPLGAGRVSRPTVRVVDDTFFELDGRSVRQGRLFDATTDIHAHIPMVVSEDYAAIVWPSGHAVGSIVRVGRDGPTAQVVGVVRARIRARSQIVTSVIAPEPEVFLPSRIGVRMQPSLRLQLRTDAATVRRILVHELARHTDAFSFSRLETLTERETLALLPMRITASVLAWSATIVVAIAAVGLYGLAAQAALARRSELGIRLALGATESQVTRMVVREMLRLTLGGAVLGLIGTVAAGYWMLGAMPISVSMVLVVWALTITGLTTVLILTCWIPVRRVARAAPADVLRAL